MLGMQSTDIKAGEAIRDVRCTDDSIEVDLADGRTIIAPLGWFPRLVHGTPAERNNWRLSSAGYGVHWPDLDEDLSARGLIEGRPSGENPASLKRWLAQRANKTAG